MPVTSTPTHKLDNLHRANVDRENQNKLSLMGHTTVFLIRKMFNVLSDHDRYLRYHLTNDTLKGHDATFV